MTDQFWNILGALMICTVAAASHPLAPAQVAHLETRLAAGWQRMITTPVVPSMIVADRSPLTP